MIEKFSDEELKQIKKRTWSANKFSKESCMCKRNVRIA